MLKRLFSWFLVSGVVCLCNLALGEGEKKEIFKDFSFNAGGTFILQGTNNIGDEDVTDGSFSVDLEIEKEISDYGKVYLYFEGGKGEGVVDELQVFSNVNANAVGDENFDLIEAWYEHYLKSIPITITFGKIDATRYIDTNQYANDETTQFLGDIFKNSPAIEFPDDNSAGIRLLITPSDFLDIELLTMDADGDWEDIFDNVFFAVQFNFKTKFLEKSGNYRVYGWLNNKNHTKWGNISKNKEENYGFGLSFDQEITDTLGVFVRYGWQNPEVYVEDAEEDADFSLEQSWSIGFQFSGCLWKRDNDVFGIAFGKVIPSDDYKKANNRNAETESHLETYYNFKVNDHLSISPDIQLIWNPYGCDGVSGDKTIFVGGIRTQVDF